VLPSAPFDQDAPEIPLPAPTAREVELWNLAWAAPQAWMWIQEPWRWQTIGLWVRRTALAESKDANASDINAVIRLADQIGMTPAGLKENGWAIAADKAGPSQAEKPEQSERSTSRSKDRFRVVRGDGNAA
jgi:hypothetical protein